MKLDNRIARRNRTQGARTRSTADTQTSIDKNEKIEIGRGSYSRLFTGGIRTKR